MSEQTSSIDNIIVPILSLERFLDLAIATKAEDLARLQEDINTNESRWSKLVHEIRGLTKDIDALDTDDLEEIKKVPWEHKWSVSSWTPDATFNVTTDFPIRHFHDDEKPSSSKWKKVSNHQGTKQFSAVLKNTRNRSVATALRLSGHRREVFADQIKSLEQEREQLREKQDKLKKTWLRKEAYLDKFKTGASLHLSHQSLAEVDLHKLQQLPYSSVPNTSNPYVLASKLGLRSKVYRTHVVDRDIHSMMEAEFSSPLFNARKAWLLEGHQHRIELANFVSSQDDRFSSEHSAALAIDVQAIRKLQTTLLAKTSLEPVLAFTSKSPKHTPYFKSVRTKYSSHQLSTRISWTRTSLELPPKLPMPSKSGIDTPRGTPVPSKSEENQATSTAETAGGKARVEYLKKLQDFQAQVAKSLTDCVQTLEMTADTRHNSTELAECKDQLIRADKQARKDIKATASMLSILQKESWPIGVYLCFVGAQDAETGWLAVWEGIQNAL